MGHMLKSRLPTSSFANEKQEWQLNGEDMTIDHIAIPKAPMKNTQLWNNQTAPQLQMPSNPWQGSKNWLTIHQVCYPACFQLCTGFPTKFHVSQENAWRIAPRKVHICLPKLWHTPKDPSFPKELQEGSKTRTEHQQGFIIQTSNYRAEILPYLQFSIPMPWAKKTSWAAAIMLTLYQEEHQGALFQAGINHQVPL